MVQRFNLPASSHRLLPVAAILYISVSLQYSSVDSFAPTNPIHHHHHHHHHHHVSLHQSNNNIIDAEVIPDDELNNDNSNTATIPANQESSLIEYSQNQDPDWKSMPVAFCDTVSNSYIDCNLAFYVKDPNGATGAAEYALGVPCEVPIVVALEYEENDETREGDDGSSTVINLSKVLPINPDGNTAGSNIMKDEEKEEIFQLAARALMDEFGQGIRLKKTPRALTMEGDLEEVIGDWREVLLGSVSGKDGDGKENGGFSFEDALNLLGDDDDDDDDEDDNEGEGDYFDTIMKRDLGEDYMKLVEDEDDDDGVDEELLKLFDLAGLDDSSGDLQDLMDDVTAKEQNVKDANYEQLVQQLAPSAALKLLNFLGPGGKEYTILRPLRPILLVGKEDPEDYTRRILLTEEEQFEILPRLESACREGLEKAGFFLSSNE